MIFWNNNDSAQLELPYFLSFRSVTTYSLLLSYPQRKIAAEQCSRHFGTDPEVFAYYFLNLHLHHFSKLKIHKEVAKQYGFRVFLLFLLDYRRIRTRIRTSYYWPKIIRIRIRNTAAENSFYNLTCVKARDVGGPVDERDLHPPERHPPRADRQAGDGQQHSLWGGSTRHVHKSAIGRSSEQSWESDSFSESDILLWMRSSRVVRALTANAIVATVQGSIPATSDTVESEGRQTKQCWISYIRRKNSKKIPL